MKKTNQLLNNRYKLTRQLDPGGMGIVYEAFDTILDSPVAIKQCIFDEEILRRAFKREAQLLANLKHPSLPYSLDFFSRGNQQFLVMEFIGGKTMEELLADDPHGLPTATVKDFAKQMLDVVEYLHSESVVHRDIKTSNLKVMDGRVYLLDFGVAYGHMGEMNTVVKGDYDYSAHSRHYSPPEQLQNQPPNPAGDLYSLAATVYKLMSGKPPEDAASRVKNNEELTRPMSEPGNSDFVLGIMRTLSLNPKERPQSAAEMRELLFPPKPAEVHAPVKQEQSVSKPGRSKVVSSVLSASLILVVTFVIFLAKPTYPPPPQLPSDCQAEISKVQSQFARIREADNQANQSEAWTLQANEDEAGKTANNAIELDHGNTKARRILGELSRSVRFDEADFQSPSKEARIHAEAIIQLLNNQSRSSKLSVSELCDLAWAYFELSEHSKDKTLIEKAIGYTNEALKVQPNSVPASMLLAELTYEEHVRERDAYNAAVAPAPILKSLIKMMDRVLLAYPLYARAYIVRGNLYAAANEIDLALKDFSRAARLNPRPSTHYLVAAAFLQKLEPTIEDEENACKYLALTLKANPKFEPARNALKELCKEATDQRFVSFCRNEAVL